MKQAVSKVVVLTAAFLAGSQAYAWGERGHDLITRVAVRWVIAKDSSGRMSPAFAEREHMLGHLANVPDIVWRNGDKQTIKENAPTHFIDLDLLDSNPSLTRIDMTPSGAKAQATKNGKSLAEEVGTAPWRVGQLSRLMHDSFKVGKIDDALMYGGILSHFVGDLAQPLHTAKNYDGWETDQGGLHKYFESDVVDSYPLSFDQEVLEAAIKGKGMGQLLASVPPKERDQYLAQPVLLAFALAQNSFEQIAELEKIDRDRAVIKKSISEPLKQKALRKPPKESGLYFKGLIVQRMALAAQTLAFLWIKAWEDSGKPDLSNFKSYRYPVAPEFIKPDYLP